MYECSLHKIWWNTSEILTKMFSTWLWTLMYYKSWVEKMNCQRITINYAHNKNYPVNIRKYTCINYKKKLSDPRIILLHWFKLHYIRNEKMSGTVHWDEVKRKFITLIIGIHNSTVLSWETNHNAPSMKNIYHRVLYCVTQVQQTLKQRQQSVI